MDQRAQARRRRARSPCPIGDQRASDAVRTTIVSLTGSPTSGALGTPVTWTLQPAVGPLSFDPNATASWVGVYKPNSGVASAQFTIGFNASQVREQNASTAVIVLGDGSASGTPGPTGLVTPGVFEGQTSITFSALALSKGMSVAVSQLPFLARIVYANTSVAQGPPSLGGAVSAPPVLYTNGTAPSVSAVSAAGWAHITPVLLIQDNPFTAASAPASLAVRVAVFDPNDTVVSEVPSLTLTRRPDPDGDPNNVVYASDLLTPLVLIDLQVNPANYPGFHMLYVLPNAVDVRVVPTQ